MTYTQPAQPVVVVNNNATLPQWITAGCSVVTLGIVAYTATTVSYTHLTLPTKRIV